MINYSDLTGQRDPDPTWIKNVTDTIREAIHVGLATKRFKLVTFDGRTRHLVAAESIDLGSISCQFYDYGESEAENIDVQVSLGGWDVLNVQLLHSGHPVRIDLDLP